MWDIPSKHLQSLLGVFIVHKKKSKGENTQNNGNALSLFQSEKKLALSLYKNGIEFTGRNAKEAIKSHREVAKQGWAPALYNLGCCYNDGKGARDPKEAVKWFSKAAEQGHPETQNQ